MTQEQTVKLRQLYASSSAGRMLLDNFAERERDRRLTPLAWAKAFIRRQGGTDHEVLPFLRGLEAAGCGQYIEGRHGQASRFKWGFPMRSVARLAQGTNTEPAEVELRQIEPDAVNINGEMLDHKLFLRPDLLITITLPHDLTANEAERLASFVKALPFSAPGQEL